MRASSIRALTPRDRHFLGFFAAYWLFGLVSNTVRASEDAPPWLRNGVAIVGLVAVAAWVVYLGYGIRTRRYRGTDLGCTFETSWSIVLAVLAAGYVLFALVRTPSPGLAQPATLVLPLVSVIVEEVVFRPLLIGTLQRAFVAQRRPVLWAVVVATLVWTLVHVPSYPLGMLIGGPLLGGLILGGLYAVSGSNVLGFVVHAWANAGTLGSAVAFALYLVLAAFFRHRR